MSDPQLLAVAPHLCGFTKAVARRRLIVPVTVFCDESGKSEPPAFVMVGLMAPAENWARFNEEWQAVLNEPPSIEAFHMAESRWNGQSAKLPKLIEIIKRHTVVAFAVSVNNAEYRDAFSDNFSKVMNSPYYFMYSSLIGRMTIWQIDNDMNEKMDFIFDEQDDQADYIQSNYSAMLDSMSHEMRERIGVRPIHADDKKILPLQAADIVAWSIRRRMYMEEKGEILESDVAELFKDFPLYHSHESKEMLNFIAEGARRLHVKTNCVSELNYAKALPRMDQVYVLINKNIMEEAKGEEELALCSFPAKQTKRYRLVRSCHLCDSPHLHRRAGGECLGVLQVDHLA